MSSRPKRDTKPRKVYSPTNSSSGIPPRVLKLAEKVQKLQSEMNRTQMEIDQKMQEIDRMMMTQQTDNDMSTMSSYYRHNREDLEAAFPTMKYIGKKRGKKSQKKSKSKKSKKRSMRRQRK